MSDVVERLSWWLRYFNDETDKWKDAHPDYRHDPTGFDETAIEGDLRDAIEKIQRLRKALDWLQDQGCQSKYPTCLERYPNNRNMWCFSCVATKALKGEEK